jgi:hypothetical protein
MNFDFSGIGIGELIINPEIRGKSNYEPVSQLMLGGF